jgi:hypothetical protein
MHLDVRVYFGALLLDREMLGTVQQICAELAPSWSSKLHVYDSPHGAPQVPIGAPDALFNATKTEVTEHGPFYKKLERRFGLPKHTGISGMVELRGGNSSITVVLSVDKRRFLQVGDIWIWGNHISFQLRAKRIEGRSAAEFAEILFNELCSRLPVWYGHAEETKEFDAKNISREGGGMAAIGVDISKALPGLYWLNFFGRHVVEEIGREKFAAVSAFSKKTIGDGIMLRAIRDPSGWQEPGQAEAEMNVMSTLGEQYFFLRSEPFRNTRSPFNVN